MMKKVMLCVGLAGMWFVALHAQISPKPFTLDVHHALFATSASEGDLEIYYALYPQEWCYRPADSGDSLSSVMMELLIFRESDLVHRDVWKLENRIHSGESEEEASRTTMDKLRLRVPVGTYSALIRATDLNDRSHADSAAIDFAVGEHAEEDVVLSDLLFCREIRGVEENDPTLFVKDSLYVLPNPSRFYTDGDLEVDFYVELSHLLAGVPGNTYAIKYFVTDYNGNTMEAVPIKEETREKETDTYAERDAVSVAELPSGTYFLRFEVLDPSVESVIHSTQGRFFVYNPAVDKQREALAASRKNIYFNLFEHMEDVDIEQEILYIDYLMTIEEKELIKKLDSKEAKKNFLHGFWKVRDPDPSTVENEYRTAYLRLIREANEKFAGMNEGWKSDFGYVYVRYGPADNVIRYPSTARGNAYEVWRYDQIEGGVEFVFVDIYGINRYELVHSTKRGERQNYNYQQLIDRTTGQYTNPALY